MEAIILAGGQGTRLRDVVPDLPKPMAPVAGRPFLEILIGSLARKGVTRAIISVGYMADKIRSHFGSRFADIDIAYAIEEVPLGTGGGLRLAMQEACLDHVFIFNGDTFLDLDLAAVEAQWQQRRRPLIVGRMVSESARYNCLQVETGRVVGFSDKGAIGNGIINAGCYVFDARQFDRIPCGHAFSIEADYLPREVGDNPFDLFLSNETFIDIGVPEDYERAQSMLAEYGTF